MVLESSVRLLQAFWQYFGISQHGEKIRVAVPAGNDVQMQVAGHTGTRRMAKIHADVESIRTILSSENPYTSLSEIPHFCTCLHGQTPKIGAVRVRSDQQVPRVVRIQI